MNTKNKELLKVKTQLDNALSAEYALNPHDFAQRSSIERDGSHVIYKCGDFSAMVLCYMFNPETIAIQEGTLLSALQCSANAIAVVGKDKAQGIYAIKQPNGSLSASIYGAQYVYSTYNEAVWLTQKATAIGVARDKYFDTHAHVGSLLKL